MAVIKRTCCLQVVLAMAHGFGDVMPMELSDKMKKVVWQWPIWDTSHRKRNGKKIWRPNRLCWILCSIHSMPWKWGHRPWPKCCWWWFPGLLSFFCWISQRGEDPNDWFAEGWKTTTKNGFQNQPSQIWLRGNVQCSQLAAIIWVSSKAWWWFHSEIRLSYPHSWRILSFSHSVLGCQPLLQVKPPTKPLHIVLEKGSSSRKDGWSAEVGIKLKDVQWPKSFPSCGTYPRIEGHFDLLTKNT